MAAIHTVRSGGDTGVAAGVTHYGQTGMSDFFPPQPGVCPERNSQPSTV